MMVGREIARAFPPKPARDRRPQPLLEVEALSWAGRLADISFGVGRGEIVGLGGLDGQGQRELLLALFGVLRGVEGRIKVAGREVAIDSPARAQSAPIDLALIPEERKTDGLLLHRSIGEKNSLGARTDERRGGDEG